MFGFKTSLGRIYDDSSNYSSWSKHLSGRLWSSSCLALAIFRRSLSIWMPSIFKCSICTKELSFYMTSQDIVRHHDVLWCLMIIGVGTGGGELGPPQYFTSRLHACSCDRGVYYARPFQNWIASYAYDDSLLMSHNNDLTSHSKRSLLHTQHISEYLGVNLIRQLSPPIINHHCGY